MSARNHPIIVIKKTGGHGGHHGGAWKVAYADFVTAMMSLFIVLWLMGSSQKVRRAVAGYFNDPKGTANLLGTTMSGNSDASVQTDSHMKLLKQLKEKLEKEIQARKDLEKLSKQIEITITSEGLRIELLESKNGTFFQLGSAQLSENGQKLLALLASELKTLPNKLLIEGHTDATPYSKGADYTNWELSADRANAARRLLQSDGVGPDQVTQIRGYADELLRVPANPFDPSNRRITILVKNDTGTPPPLSYPGATVVGGAPSPSRAALKPQNAPPVSPAGKPEAPAAKVAASPPGKPSPSQAGLFGRLQALLPRGKK